MERTTAASSSIDCWRSERGLVLLTTGRAAGGFRTELSRMLAVCGIGTARRPLTCEQVHGTQVVWACDGHAGTYAGADGVLTDDPADAVCIFTADCVPLFVWESTGPLFGLVHVGRRGLLQGIAENTVMAAVQHGVRPADMRFLIGPHVCGQCYTVDPRSAVGARYGYQEETGRFSLARELIGRLREMGIRNDQIIQPGGCTVHDTGRWHSFRAGSGELRNLSVIYRTTT